MSLLTFDSPGSKFRSRCYTVKMIVLKLHCYPMILSTVGHAQNGMDVRTHFVYGRGRGQKVVLQNDNTGGSLVRNVRFPTIYLNGF